ncbi:MAG: outer membrane protein assembly factor BamA [Nitrospirota bacterium]
MAGRRGWGVRAATVLAVWGLMAISAAVAFAEGPRILSVTVRGASTIEAPTIISRSALAVGGTADPAAIRDAIKTVYRMGYFDEVAVEQEPEADGVHLVIVVSERPLLTEIRYEGYSQVSEDKLKEQVTLTPQTFVDLRAVSAAAAKIQHYYQSEGYGDARVIPVTKTVAPGSVSVTFYVEEGERAKIRVVTFAGNSHVPSKRLRTVVSTRPYSWLTSWVTSRGIFKQDELDQDVERLRDFYLNEGYVQVQVGAPKISPAPKGKGLQVTFPVEEGDQYTVARIQVSGHALFSTPELLTGLALHEGDIFRRNLLRQDMTRLTDRYGERGYAFVDIRPQFVPKPDSRSIDLTYEIREGRPVTVRTIAVEGNEKTYDRVIRRELRVAEQELVDTTALKRSFQRINNLNFFENVEILPNPIGDDQMDITVRVKEKPTGTFSLGGGYSSVDGVIFQANIEQGNLFGRGQLLRARMEKSSRRTSNYTLTFREPYLLDRPVSGTIDLYSNERQYTTYKDARAGFSLGLRRAFGEYVSAGVSYTRETSRVYDLALLGVADPTPPDPVTGIDPVPGDEFLVSSAPQAIQAEAALGKVTTSSVGFSVGRDTRDFAFDPRQGQRHSLSLELAGGPFGGDNQFYRIVTDSAAFFPAFWSTVFSLHLRFGYLAGDQYPFAERFIVGGINTVRGFDYGKAGRVDPFTGEIFGGNKELIFNAEYTFPLIPDAKMKGVIFFDAGRSFDDQGRYVIDQNGNPVVLVGPDGVPMTSGEPLRIRELRYSAGFGIRMLLPIGPIRLEWGYNLDAQPGEKTGAFPEFTIGTVF